jgi:hypothetical protein
MIIMYTSIVIFAMGASVFVLDVVGGSLSDCPTYTPKYILRCLCLSIVLCLVGYGVGQLTTYTCFSGHCGYPEEDAELKGKINSYNQKSIG